jgi:hypothetical protein
MVREDSSMVYVTNLYPVPCMAGVYYCHSNSNTKLVFLSNIPFSISFSKERVYQIARASEEEIGKHWREKGPVLDERYMLT